MPVLSIIVPVYNVERYVIECLDSICKQTFSDFEIVVVDDGSTDNSLSLIRNYAQNDNRIRIIHQENKGLSGARNTGLNYANGELISFIDSDDTIEPNMYEVLIHKLEENSVDMVICGYYRFDKKEKNVCYKPMKNIMLHSDDNDFYKYTIGSVCNKIFKREIINTHSLRFIDKDILPSEDYSFLVRYFAHIQKIYTVSDVLYNYRVRQSSITNSPQKEDFFIKSLLLIEFMYEYCKKKSCKLIENDEFFTWMFNYLLRSSISMYNPLNYTNILNCIKVASKSPYYYNKCKYNELTSNKYKNIYLKIIRFISKHQMIHIHAILEYIRVKRLQNKYLKRNNNDQNYI